MKHIVKCISLLLLMAPALSAQSCKMISPAEAIHLVEYQLQRMQAGRFVPTAVETEDSFYIIVGDYHGGGFKARVDGVRARVSRMSRNDKIIYEWDGIKVVGHRGNVKFAPENTIPALEKAIELGVDLVEIDIRQTLDSELILMHDATVDRTTDGTGRVDEFTLAQIQVLDAGSWFSSEFQNIRVPTLREALSVIQGKALPDLDFKAGSPQKLIDILKEEKLLGKVTLYCGDWDLMEEALRLAPEGFLLRPTVPMGEPGLPTVLQTFDPPVININWDEFSETLVRKVHLAGKVSFLNAMQNDNELIMRLMMETLPDYLQSDHVDVLLPMLRAAGLHD